MSVLDKIDKFMGKVNPSVKDKFKKHLVKEDIDEGGLNSDIIDLLNSLDDDMLSDEQLELKDRILSSYDYVDVDDGADIPIDDDDIEVPIDDLDLDLDLDIDLDDGFVDESKKITRKKSVTKK